MKVSLLILFLVLPALLLQACAVDLQGFVADKNIQIADNQITAWPEAVEESSGLALHNDLIWTINDSGDDAYIYGLNQQGALVKKISINNGQNFDYEELAQDEKYLYVADIGDNFFQRKQLLIYRLSWEDIDRAEHQGAVTAKLITVQLNDTSKFNHKYSHNYDFEALSVKGDELWLFSKNRLDGNSELYRLPKQPGTYKVDSTVSFATKGLVTAADIHPTTQMAALLAYQIHHRSFASYFWLVPVGSDGLDWSKAESYEISPGGQWEAIKWSLDGSELLLSREDNHQGGMAVARIKFD